jgi:hypothetical protein
MAGFNVREPSRIRKALLSVAGRFYVVRLRHTGPGSISKRKSGLQHSRHLAGHAARGQRPARGNQDLKNR